MTAYTYMNADIGHNFGQETTMVQFYLKNVLDFLSPYRWLFGILKTLNCKTLGELAGSQNPMAVLYRNTVSAFTSEHELPLMWSHPEEGKPSELHWSGLKVKMQAAPVECRLHLILSEVASPRSRHLSAVAGWCFLGWNCLSWDNRAHWPNRNMIRKGGSLWGLHVKTTHRWHTSRQQWCKSCG